MVFTAPTGERCHIWAIRWWWTWTSEKTGIYTSWPAPPHNRKRLQQQRHHRTVVPNLFCPKVYFSSSHPPEIYQSSVNIAYSFTSFPACSSLLHNTFLLSQNHPGHTCHITNLSLLKHIHARTILFESNRK